MNRTFLAVLFVIFFAGNLSACTDEEKAALTGAMAGAVAGSLIVDNDNSGDNGYRDRRDRRNHRDRRDHRDSRHSRPCEGVHGYQLAQCQCDVYNNCRLLDRYNRDNRNRY